MTDAPPGSSSAEEGVPLAGPDVGATSVGETSDDNPFDAIWQRLREHKVLQWALGYFGASLALADGEGLIAHAFHWPDAVGQVLIGALIVGFPVAVVVAWYHGHKGLKSFSPAEMTIVALLVLVGGGSMIALLRPPAGTNIEAATVPSVRPTAKQARHPFVPKTAGMTVAQRIAEIGKLVRTDRYEAAFMLARPLLTDPKAATDGALQALWSEINLPMRPLVTESGATVFFKAYGDTNGPWIKAGVTPFAKAVDAPRGVLRLKVEKRGFRTGYFAIHNPGPSVYSPEGVYLEVAMPLAPNGLIPDDMALVPATDTSVYVSGWSQSLTGSDRHGIPAFAIAKYEVTNQEFKAFVDAGGYDNPTYWDGLKYEDKGHALSWAQARKRFVDTTNRPGPAGWRLSTYPTGQADLPVGGISWYEAVAYARFRGQMLPTIHHWARAAMAPYEAWQNSIAPSVVLSSRFSSDGPIAAHSEVGLGAWGTLNMAGNVREWLWNFAGDRAIAMGGAWSDYAMFAHQVFTTSPMDRQPEIGLRLMSPLPGTSIDGELLKPIALASDVAHYDRAPVSNDAFEAMRFQFSSTHAKPVQTSVHKLFETPLWIGEEVILKFSGQSPLSLYIVRPPKHLNPLQVVIYGPPGDASLPGQPNRAVIQQLRPPADTVVESGRALVMPIWQGSYGLAVQAPPRDENETREILRQWALAWYPQISATLDYLETRPDMDTARAGFLGFSAGASLIGPLVLALEGRLKTAVLVSGGVTPAPGMHPMADAVNYAPHVKVPVLFVGGRYDHIYLYEQSQTRLFNLLGTPPGQKKQLVYDVGHFVFPSNTITMEIGDWFDKYLGPVH